MSVLDFASPSGLKHCNKPTYPTSNPQELSLGRLPSLSPRRQMPFENLDISIIPKSYLFLSTIPSDRSPCFGFRIEPLTESGVAGEVTVALLPTRDLAGVHNAIGITYQTPHSGTVLWSRLNTLVREGVISISSWYLGGNIIAGASRAGVPLAKKLRAECWIGAHDEENISGGVIMKFSQE
ncbi:hypothetical protein BDDG_10075 [Blastomyces dermatitidis ATCC 18188]|uniref:Uncharacterized protein n=1 Tax=Ajellomyces dermatitidis (strain ATCC 18188 / CBS 674.68) TaxID=653446 RepID=F2TV60_AJEDA|nr:hypothetical protein BDDG_10075 [Blastomyces dermatitidis ATCC 18188]